MPIGSVGLTNAKSVQLRSLGANYLIIQSAILIKAIIHLHDKKLKKKLLFGQEDNGAAGDRERAIDFVANPFENLAENKTNSFVFLFLLHVQSVG